ncbi:NAD(P)/FAD-dependent oxidoreductase [Gimibacter soli]|uniref:FAD-dependent oxidoreductase n=1 Tax=Gimibacter soli TaxID=3024400 RepID=A0AAE9XWM1_9PROT|nr:FAD-dependent oxidoreductase [Gimibacter soli]WCL54714.1 FAD-dependent oxidoreductase [Gimibacter soli]
MGQVGMVEAGINNILLIGAGQAAIQLAHSLRMKGFEGAITLIGEEAYPPYQRPPLSKAFLKGEMEEPRLYLKPESFYTDKKVALVTRTRAAAIDRAARVVTTSDGKMHGYDRLVIATGTRPRLLDELTGIRGVQVMRGIDDAKALKARVGDLRHVTLLGGGYIGLEAAAVLAEAGIAVTVLERMPRLLSRVTGEAISDYFLSLHQSHGVDVRLNAEVERFVTADGHISGIVMKGGETFVTDLLMVGIGVLPNQELAADAGIACANGISVDEDCLTSDPAIYAIGDCAFRPLAGQEGRLRLESVPNAIEMAEIAACHITGNPRPAYDAPWFWSDQYSTKIQTAGLFTGHTSTVVRGTPESGKFAVFYFRDDAFIAVDAINDAQAFMLGKQVLKAGLPLTAAMVADEARPIPEILKTLKTVGAQ